MSIQPSSYSPGLNQNEDRPSSGLDPVLLIMISLVLSSTIAILMGGLTWAYRRKSSEKPSYLQQIHRNPCQGCKYLHANTSLKCAVNPGIVMTEASADCRDYLPKRSK
jgi:hypothetical protein